MKQVETKRLVFLDTAKGVGILAVMFGHITSIGNPIDRWISTFKLPIFFVITGFLLCRSQEISTAPFRSFTGKKARALLIPYFSFSLLTILYRIAIAVFKGKDLTYLIDHFAADIYTTISLRGLKALWFLTALFLAEILFYLVMRLHLIGKVLSALIAMIIFFQTSNLLDLLKEAYGESLLYPLISMPILVITKGIAGSLFLAAGYIFYRIMQKLPNKRNRLILGLILSVANIFLNFINSGTLDFNNMRFGTFPLLFFICALFGSAGWILVLEYMVSFYHFPILSWCGQNSLILMATHTAFGFKDIMVNGWAGIASLSSKACLKYYVECLIILALLLIFEYGIVDFINKKAPFLIGRFKKRGNKTDI